MIKLPYGLSNFEKIREQGYFFVDRTSFVRTLEELDTHYLFFLRPRRFGKSLWVSILEHYYGLCWAPQFEMLFGGLEIGRKPTPGANQYLVLKFDFSGIDSSDMDLMQTGFLRQVKTGAERFMQNYADRFDASDKKRILSAPDAAAVLSELFRVREAKAPEHRIYLLIDEYDHFTNRLFVLERSAFDRIVRQDGFYRAFFEAVKIGTQERSIERIFITGVSPITLDSLTSGFNIGHNLTLDHRFQDMLGFKEAEVAQILRGSGVAEEALANVLQDIRLWYNGYRFSKRGEARLYNPDMALYFAREYQALGSYPETMLDINIASDYQRIAKMLHLGDYERNAEDLTRLLEEGSLTAQLTEQFNPERDWTRDDFISSLFYNGLVTIESSVASFLRFKVPNYVIQELYFGLFRELILRQANLSVSQADTGQEVLRMAMHNDPRPFFELICAVLASLDNRDYVKMSEKHLKSIAAAFLYAANVFFLRSEAPVGSGYVDLLLLQRPGIEIEYQLAIELKHVKKKEAEKAPAVLDEARQQLRSYLSHPDLKAMAGERLPLCGWVAVIVGSELFTLEEVAG